MSVLELYNSLLSSKPNLAKVILDTDSTERYVCFEVDENELLAKFVKERYRDVVHGCIESLQSEEELVLNIMFFDNEGEHVAGCEITKEKIYWDDEQ